MDCKTFFEAYAPHWDDDYQPHAPVRRAAALLCGAAGHTVLDIACGTGAMFPELAEAGASCITGVDICPGMAERAAQKFAGQPGVSVFCADVLQWQPGPGQPCYFDTALMYNAYPHFLDKPALLRAVAGLLAPGGRFTVAHGMGRQALNRHHQGVPAAVSTPLGPAAEEAACWSPLFEIDILCDTPQFYCISGRKRPGTAHNTEELR
ncbi:MAG: class I SAM-dependent methyltransferase [Gemmiger sp.]|nr:class I SAM-dependent methyltransferase [Gemmiger sp.]